MILVWAVFSVKRLCEFIMGNSFLKRLLGAWVFACLALQTSLPLFAADSVPAVIDATTLHKKVLCGYQGWFRCAGDEAGEGWRHWSRNSQRFTADSLTVEMWPDMSEYTAEEKFAVPGFTYPNGTAAELFSSVHGKTVERHFEWMRDYGIDGVFLQRFLVEANKPASALVLKHVRAAAAKTGRAYAMCYDVSGFPAEKIEAALLADWRKLVEEEKLTQDKNYLHHNGRPVLFVWGFFSDRFSPAIANRLIDGLQGTDGNSVTLVGGCQWYWRRETNAEWAQVFRRFDVISPWNVGNTMTAAGQKQAATHYWQDDLAAANRAGMKYLPVIYPGFGWTNLKGAAATNQTIPRLGGEFFWRQFHTAANLKIEMAYVAMFDEVDEATAIFKVTNSPPTQAKFQTYEGLPPDWYLRLTGAGSKLLRGEMKNQLKLPIKP